MSDKAKRLLIAEGATVIVSAEMTPLRRDTGDRAAPVTKVRWLSRLEVDGRRLKGAPLGWIPVLAELPNARGRGPTPLWVRHQDIVIGDGFRKVTACWPIKKVEVEGGDWAAGFTFSPDGSGTFASSFDEAHPDEKTKGRIHVYIDKNIVALESDDSRGPAFPDLGIKYSEKLIFAYGKPVEETVPFDDAELVGCKTIVTDAAK